MNRILFFLQKLFKRITNFFLIFFLILTHSKNLYSKEIPIIVIAPNKNPQSLSTVGTSVTIFDEDYFKNSTEYFLGDVLSSNTTSTNFFQNGGHGTTSAISAGNGPHFKTDRFVRWHWSHFLHTRLTRSRMSLQWKHWLTVSGVLVTPG